MKRVLALLLFSTTVLAGNAFAQGALDFADPCKAQEGKFDSTTTALRQNADALIAQWDGLSEPPGELRPIYVEAVRAGAYQQWSQNPMIKGLLAQMAQTSPTFEPKNYFVVNVYPQVYTQELEAEAVRTLFKADYQANLRPKFIAERGELEKTIDGQKAKLDAACSPDVFNQYFRATVGNLMLIYKGNEQAAANEKGDVAAAIRLMSGISITDILEHGLLGGENSEIRKMFNNLGLGANSDLGKLVQSLDPSQWKIDLPNIPLPKIDLPKVDLPRIDPPLPPAKATIPLVNVEVCVPWC
ncbi:hypothetical protein ASC97_05850 [Rhizobium sp. Root1203]|uniref:hypothetical protein n=1 Tax=Rhizobium sp. Root1203 TaxID=1736427 RepID=UPI000709CAE7|nr:hypothetical protein [Rhizobium sp. Root1203]KQV27885.1 hypothetical protein ASC97_05850 [Rhizobium sp. Root1203]